MKIHQYRDVHFRGTIERVSYMTTNRDGEPRDKYANVYLPYGYDAADTAKRYNILYLMHGGGGNSDAWLDCCKIKNMLDHAFLNGEAEPFIVVFPSYYKEKIGRIGGPVPPDENFHVRFFQQELREELIPAVESKYNTYAEDVTPEALKASYAHRGFGGFSMGSCTTWYAFCDNNEYFGTYIPLSGDCWVNGLERGEGHYAKTAEILADIAKKSHMNFKIYAATGTEDMANRGIGAQIEEMKKLTDVFKFSEDYAEGNLHYLLADGMRHAYEDVFQYVYNYLPYLFK